MSEVYHISIIPRSGITTEQVDNVMYKALDWLRYKDGCYFVWTTASAQQWYQRLAPLVNPGGVAIIFRVDLSDYNGFANKEIVWPWLDKYRRATIGS